MGVREFVEKQKRWIIPATVIGVGACAFSAWRGYRGEQLPGIVERAYYSDDDGKTYFADDVSKGISFDHGGKTAYRVFVYRCGSGKPFVGVLAKVVGQSAAAAIPLPSPRYKGQSGPPPALELKKPADSKWVLSASPEGQALLNSLCPKNTLEAILP